MIYFTADTHFGHEKIIKPCHRPFSDKDDMDRQLIDRWNSVVTKRDTIYVLGDFSFYPAQKTEEIFRQLQGQKHLIQGNHDRRSGLMKRLFNSVRDLREVKLYNGNRAVLCHFALLTWHKQHYGSIMLHGHSHGSLPRQPGVRRLDVGVDVWDYTPVSEERIIAELEGIEAEPPDYHRAHYAEE